MAFVQKVGWRKGKAEEPKALFLVWMAGNETFPKSDRYPDMIGFEISRQDVVFY